MAKSSQKISNKEIKNFIEHSFKIIISSFNDRLEQIEKRLTSLEESVNVERKISNLDPEKDKTTKKPAKNDLSDALKLIGK